MNPQNRALNSRLSLVAIAIGYAFPAFSQTIDPERVDAIADITTAQNEVRFGLGYLSDPSRRAGMYTGQRDQGGYLSADINLHSFDKDSGIRFRLTGRDLTLEQRELAFDYARQGQWRYFAGISQGVRYEPMVVNTGLSGIGTEAVTVNGEPIRPVDLRMKRDLFSAGLSHNFNRDNAVHVRFTHETKDGGRLFGRGNTTAPAALEFLAEPIDRTTETLEISFSHVGENLQLNGGYYGTLFANHTNGLYVTDGASSFNTTTTVAAFSPMSMPLDNNSHQLFITGGYSLTPLTRATFKASQTVAQQNENLIVPNVLVGNGGTVPASPCPVVHCPGGIPASLNARVDTLIAYLDLTSFEIDRVDIQANIRYEDRNDKTPVAKYMSGADDPTNIAGAVQTATSAGVTGFNKPRSWSSLKSKVEAGYQLPSQFKVLGGWELDHQERNAPERFSKVNFRTETDESSLYLEAKRSILDTLSGALSYRNSQRNGSSYTLDTYLSSSDPANSVNPLLWADRDRTTWKVTGDWVPAEEWAVHLVHEKSSDHYEGMGLGPRDGFRMFYSVDASYALTERWNAHLWWSRDDTRAEQTTQTGAGSAGRWQAKLRQLSEGVGAGLQGKTRSGMELGVDLSYSDQAAQQRMTSLSATAITSLPDYYYRVTELKVFGVYPLDKQSGVRADYSFQDWKTNDWTWRGWQYSDGTTLTQEVSQRAHFVGASYYYRWR